MPSSPSTSQQATPSTPPRSLRKNLHKSPFTSPSLNRSCDRFIPSRDVQDSEVSSWLLRKQPPSKSPPDSADNSDVSSRDQRYKHQIASRLLEGMGYSPGRGGGGGGGAGAGGGAAFDVGAGGESFANTPRVLNFGSPHNSPMKRPASKNTESESHRAIKSMHSKMSANDHLNRKAKRAIPTAPERVLDAPGLLNDYYLNLVDWNCKNILAVALDKTVYLWNAATREIQELLSLDGANYVSSLSYVHENGNLLAIGTSDHKVQIWDIAAIAKVREMRGHSARVGSLAWRGPLLTSGSKDTTIINHDHRVSRHIVSTYKSHRQEVCGLAWNSDGLTLASGGNDNLLALWDVRRQNSGESHYDEPTHSCKDHLAAVKALAWSPHQRNVLATGGGTADRTIKIWNAANGKCLNSVNTGSQVCSLIWNKNEKELLSSHGFSENQLCLWKYPSMERLAELKGHTGRVLYMCQGPTGQICSAGADETLRFWNVFGTQSAHLTSKKHTQMSGSRRQFTTRVNLR